MFTRFSRIKLGLYLLLFLLVLSRFYAPMEQLQNRFIVSIFNPILLSNHFISKKFSSIKNWIICRGDLCQENLKLKEELENKNLRLMELESILQVQKKWDSLQAFSFFADYDKIAAQVIAYNPSLLIQTIRINRGKEHNISLGCPVLVPEGLVGIVAEVYEKSAVVHLATDVRFQVGAAIKNKEQKGLVKGFHKKMEFERYFAMNRLEYLQNTADIAEGDEVRTSGLDGFFPQGIPLGKVSHVSRDEKKTFLSAELVSWVDFLNLDAVLVLRKKEAL